MAVARKRRRKFLVLDEGVTGAQAREFTTQQAEIASHLTPIFNNRASQTDWWADYRVFKSPNGKNIVIEKIAHRRTPDKHTERRLHIVIALNAYAQFAKMVDEADSWLRKHEKADALSDPAAGLADTYDSDCPDVPGEG